MMKYEKEQNVEHDQHHLKNLICNSKLLFDLFNKCVISNLKLLHSSQTKLSQCVEEKVCNQINP